MKKYYFTAILGVLFSSLNPCYGNCYRNNLSADTLVRKHHKSGIIFSGSSHQCLTREICSFLRTSPGNIDIGRFPDGELRVQIQDDVLGRDVFIVQSFSNRPDETLFETFVMADALKRARAKSITVISPYLPYSRQDKLTGTGQPLTAKLVANLLARSGVTRLITFDLHAPQIEGFYDVEVIHLHGQKLLGDTFRTVSEEKEFVIVAPDIGARKLASAAAKMLGVDVVSISKERVNPTTTKMILQGDVKGKNILIIDDMSSTGGTLVEAAKLCRDHGARKISAAVTHGLLTQNAVEKIIASGMDYFIMTDTVDLPSHLPNNFIRASIASLIAQELVAITEFGL